MGKLINPFDLSDVVIKLIQVIPYFLFDVIHKFGLRIPQRE